MKMKNKILIFAAALSPLLLFTPKINADSSPLANPRQEICLENITDEKSKKSCLKEIGILTGFGSGRISEQGKKYSVVPLSARFGYDLSEFFGWKQKDRFFFNIEPFINHVTKPSPNIEAGLTFLLMYRMPLTERISPYIELGGGGIYSTQHIHEQATQINLATHRRIGIYLFNKKKDAAVSIGYGHRHFSNASIKKPNGGVDIDYGIVGFSKFF